jgi:peptidoglycan hydrolase CwlO-like protein
MKALVTAAVLLLVVLVSASAHSKEEGVSLSAPIPEPAPARMTERKTILMNSLEAYAARARAAMELAAIDKAIANLHQLLQELKAGKQSELAYVKSVKEYIQQLKVQIAALQKEIDDLEQDIDQAPWYAGPALPAVLASLKAKRDSRREQKDVLTGKLKQRNADLAATNQTLANFDAMIADVEAKIEAKKAEEEKLEQELRAVRVTSPSEGARLLVGGSEELKLRSDQPPSTVRIELDRMGSGTGGHPAAAGWRSFYDRTWKWKQLDSVAPNVAVLHFTLEKAPEISGTMTTAAAGAPAATVTKPGEAPTARSRPSNLTLYPGDYRVRTQRVGEGAPSPWRRFSVVGRFDRKALSSPTRPQTTDIQPGTVKPPVKPPTGSPSQEAPTEDSQHRVQPSVLRRPRH